MLFANLSLSFRILLLCLTIAQTHVFETEDAVVTIVNGGSASFAAEQFRIPYRDPFISLGRTCITFDNHFGVCQSVQECYPYTKLHQSLSPLETWIIGTVGTCHFTEPSGRQVYGVCCNASRIHLQSQNENLPVHELTNGLERAKEDTASRIVNGENADPGEYPYMAAIVDKGHVFCGGTLIDSNHLLTAAHCLMSLSTRRILQLKVVLGAIDIKDPKKVERRVKTIIRHKQFDVDKLYNDVALLTLDSPVEITSDLYPVKCLDNNTTANNDGKDAVTIGWGRLKHKGPKPSSLQKVTLQLKSLDDCRLNLGSKAPGGVVDHYICAWAPSKDSCDGDSGGPLILDGCQIGIVSWGIGCASSSYGVYTRIASFHDWIERNKVKF